MINKYKVWVSDFEEFLEVKAIIYDPKTLLHNGDELFDDSYIIDEHNDCHLFKDIELIKYTGKNDIYNNLLYEGDYIYIKNKKKEIYEIKYSSKRAAWIAIPIDENSLAIPILLSRCNEWIKVGNKFEGLNNKKQCDFCNNEALYKYKKSKVCKDHLLLKLLNSGDLVGVEKIIYQDKDGNYVGSDESGDFLYDDLVKRFNIERINKNEE